MPVAARGAQGAIAAQQAARALKKDAANASSKNLAGGARAKSPSPPPEKAKKEEKPKGPLMRACCSILGFLDQTWLQTLQYIVFLVAFQSLTGTIRKPEEFYFDKHLTDTFISNPFDADHNRFQDTRRVSDIWEWTRVVLTPGLFHHSAEGEYWPDGSGYHNLVNATPMSVSDVVDADNVVSFTQGIVFKQSRAEPIPGTICFANHTCYGDGAVVDDFGDGGDKNSFGRRVDDISLAAADFHYWSANNLGANPAGTASASQLSYRNFPSGGFIAIFLPFFSDTYLEDQEGTFDQVRDHRHHEATPSNGKYPRYYCARSTYNGWHITQRCNPIAGQNDFVVRTMFEEMLVKMKRGHWIDHQTRLVSVTMQLKNNNAGVRFVARYMFELTQMGAVLPSYDMETLIDSEENDSQQNMWMTIALVLTGWFALLEGVEMLQSGPMGYFTNMWNVMDWANFGLFALVYLTLSNTRAHNDRDKAGHCPAKICVEFGYYDMWEVFSVARQAKFFMSLCVCIQLLKIVKFTNVIIPKMSLATRVLSKGCYDLLFFGIIFGVSMFAFCMLFYIQLGSFMDDFYSQTSSVIALAKALFGDFPFEEIIDNSRGYTNGILFLVYLFVAVFILLSMFLAILGEAQAEVREDERRLEAEGEFPNQYGFLGEFSEFVQKRIDKLTKKELTTEQQAEADEAEKQQQESPGLDGALNMALTKMQKKLDSSVQNRVTNLEQRLMSRLSALGDRVNGTGPTGGPGGRKGSLRDSGLSGNDSRSASRNGGGITSSDRERSRERGKSESPTRMVQRGGSEFKLVDGAAEGRPPRDRSRERGGGGEGDERRRSLTSNGSGAQNGGLAAAARAAAAENARNVLDGGGGGGGGRRDSRAGSDRIRPIARPPGAAPPRRGSCNGSSKPDLQA